MKRALKIAALVGLGLFALIQLVPYGWRHPNPPVTQDAPWPDEASERIARQSCYDCHSNEGDWPIYSYVAPMSWLVRWDVENARDELNFSEWDESSGEADDAIEQIEEGSMPLDRYTLIHRDARLSDEEVATLAVALAQMRDDDGGGGGGDDDREDERDDD
ncbi:MAG TPA: heme-binding domain-containing protein [Acidimicrobiales bacterium]|nr:heme-binding domain-containing protein [Acidimicrobiales bacterium]